MTWHLTRRHGRAMNRALRKHRLRLAAMPRGRLDLSKLPVRRLTIEEIAAAASRPEITISGPFRELTEEVLLP